MMRPSDVLLFFFFNDTATTEIYTLSLHDALPISIGFVIRNEDQKIKDYSALADTFRPGHADYTYWQKYGLRDYRGGGRADRKSTRLNSSHSQISYAVFCLKKKKKNIQRTMTHKRSNIVHY